MQTLTQHPKIVLWLGTHTRLAPPPQPLYSLASPLPLFPGLASLFPTFSPGKRFFVCLFVCCHVTQATFRFKDDFIYQTSLYIISFDNK